MYQKEGKNHDFKGNVKKIALCLNKTFFRQQAWTKYKNFIMEDVRFVKCNSNKNY